MPRRWFRAMAALAAPIVALAVPAMPVTAQPGVQVYPGMEIRQDNNVCTLGFVDMAARVAFTAGHCRGSGQVSDRGGAFVGTQVQFRDNTPDGATVDSNHPITDWQIIGLAPDAVINNVLPGGRVLVSDPAVVPTPGLPVCHFGVVTGESCGTVESVNNGWFTMSNGVVSQKGDSGGPVYVITPDGRAAIVGMFNSTWGQFPAAVSWHVTSQQAREDVISAASANVAMP
ncbi:hypothetical protein BST23_13935 [Mycolicibacterium elephantis]|uniref:Trypsin n=2 Tax=Mycolicibacterium elephantis TaxID=81858 RepID=A0A0M2ZG60_9MYCO|nr:hypothetical protein AAV95_11975 [Mycolicibacterium elephantis]OBA72794.1 hypothetical protein A5633_22015 [Mycolicibacterium elephantis]OBB19212.1 hypothetical protein A5762_17380 [Mycolicibacterium elephantis]OBE92819.1 hypothetical protein A5776_04660 [Mycolicibacterium elephantis]ORA65468.1 hypothetical protein BST23_13935 [Mycolicibacterium elephantis]